MKYYKFCLAVILIPFILIKAETVNLEKAISIALESNESVKNAKQELEKSEYVYNEAFSGALPKVEANFTYLRNLYSSKITNMNYYLTAMSNGIAGLNNTILDLHPESDLHEMSFTKMPEAETEAMNDNTLKAELSLVQPIWLGGKVGTAIEIAKIYKKMNQNAYELEKQKITTEIKKNFYNVLVLDESRKVMQMVKADAYKNLDRIEKMFKEGLVSEYDLIQARVRVNSIEPKIVSLDNYYDLAVDYLKINMGLNTDDDLEISGALNEKCQFDTTKIFDRAVSGRLEIKLLENKRDLLEQNVKIEYSNHLPNIIGLANYAFQSSNDDLADTFEKNCGVGTLNVGFTANIPIYSGFGTKARVDQARVETKKSDTDLQKTKKLITLQVKDALSKLKLAREEMVLRDKEIAENEKALAITQVRYDNGLCTQLELTGAQTALESARLTRVNTVHSLIEAMIALESATGNISQNEF